MASNSWPICSASFEFTAQYKMPVQFDTAIQIHLTNEAYRDEDDAFSKVSTLPTSILAVRIYGCTSLSHADFKIDDDILVYARVICGALGKSTRHTSFSKGKPVWNEYLFFPVQLTGNPKSKSNKLSVLIVWRDEAQDEKTGISSHKLLGKAELLLYQLARHIKVFETIDITNRKHQNVGQLQIELALVSGPFGFGQAYQLENHIHSPEEMVKVSLYPKVSPSYDGPQRRGIAAIPRRIQPSSLIPFNKRVENLEPSISETHGIKPLLKAPKTFPLLANRLTRLPGLQIGLQQQKTRASRIGYLRGILRNLDKGDAYQNLMEVKHHQPPARIKNDSKTTKNTTDTVNEGDGLHVISEDQELEEDPDEHQKVVIPRFIENLHKLEDTSSTHSSEGYSSRSSSLHSIELTPEYHRRRHYRKSSLLGALFKSRASIDANDE